MRKLLFLALAFFLPVSAHAIHTRGGGGGGGGSVTPGTYIENRATLQTGASFYVQYGTIQQTTLNEKALDVQANINGIGGDIASFFNTGNNGFSAGFNVTFDAMSNGTPTRLQFVKMVATGINHTSGSETGQFSLYVKDTGGWPATPSFLVRGDGPVEFGANGIAPYSGSTLAIGPGSGAEAYISFAHGTPVSMGHSTQGISVTDGAFVFNDDIAMYASGRMVFYDADSSAYTMLTSSPVVTTTTTIILPEGTPTVNQVMSVKSLTGRTIYLQWATQSGGGGSGGDFWVGTATSDLNASQYGLFNVSTNSWRCTLIGGTTVYWDDVPARSDAKYYLLQVHAGTATFVEAVSDGVRTGGVAGSTTTMTSWIKLAQTTLQASASPTLTTAGDIAYDSTDGNYVGYNTAPFVIGRSSITETIVISSQTGAGSGGWDSRTIPLGRWTHDRAYTIKSLTVTNYGGTSVTFNIDERASGSLNSTGTNITSAAITSAATTTTVTVFSNASIAAGAHLAFVTSTSANSGAVNYLEINIVWSEDVE